MQSVVFVVIQSVWGLFVVYELGLVILRLCIQSSGTWTVLTAKLGAWCCKNDSFETAWIRLTFITSRICGKMTVQEGRICRHCLISIHCRYESCRFWFRIICAWPVRTVNFFVCWQRYGTRFSITCWWRILRTFWLVMWRGNLLFLLVLTLKNDPILVILVKIRGFGRIMVEWIISFWFLGPFNSLAGILGVLIPTRLL